MSQNQSHVKQLSGESIDQANEFFAAHITSERIERIDKLFSDRYLLTTSGGEFSWLIPYLFAQTLAHKDFPIVFVDTYYYPQSTYKMIEQMEKAGYNMHVYQPTTDKKAITEKYGHPLELQDEKFEEFRQEVKHEPLNRAFDDITPRGWVRGIKKFSTKQRRSADFVEQKNGLVHLHPILDREYARCEQFLMKHNLPRNKDHYDFTKENLMKGECGIGDKCGIAER